MRTKKGVVTSAKMTGTVTVTVHGFVFHPIYKKRFRRSKKFMADVNGMDVAEGDTVVITECRPLSKNKCFKVTEVVHKVAQVSDVQEEEAVEKTIHREKEAPKVEKKEEKKEEKAEAPAEEATETEETETPESDSESQS